MLYNVSFILRYKALTNFSSAEKTLDLAPMIRDVRLFNEIVFRVGAYSRRALIRDVRLIEHLRY